MQTFMEINHLFNGMRAGEMERSLQKTALTPPVVSSCHHSVKIPFFVVIKHFYNYQDTGSQRKDD